MPSSFAKINASMAGKFEDADKIPQWIRHHGGVFSKMVDSNTTHLIVTEDSFKRNVEAVKDAKKLGTVKIVRSDWLYDSLQQKSLRPKDAKPYLWEKILEDEMRPRKKQKLAAASKPPSKKVQRKKPPKDPFLKKKPAPRSKTVVLPKDEIYTNPDTKEAWDATLTRIGPKLRREKFRLAIFQSIEETPTYSAYVKYSRTGTGNVSILAPPQSCLDLAKASFEKFFLLQTGLEWAQRWENQPRSPKRNSEGVVLPSHEGWYTLERGSIMSEYMKGPSLPLATPAAAPTLIDSGDALTSVDKHSLPGEGNIFTFDHDNSDDGYAESLKSYTPSPPQFAPSEPSDELKVTTFIRNAKSLTEYRASEPSDDGKAESLKRSVQSLPDFGPSGSSDEARAAFFKRIPPFSLSRRDSPIIEEPVLVDVEKLKRSAVVLLESASSRQLDDGELMDVAIDYQLDEEKVNEVEDEIADEVEYGNGKEHGADYGFTDENRDESEIVDEWGLLAGNEG
ncbi:hypothetical protein N7520_009768 [Penicillium odoratum]|uniref:uncharacterized protein n=1 Tax=Penicillium odoratum TaxID=1167516 RepID=UPI002547BB5B|nr:uncharacterized protein N7520_009768 [Penicillium odoratum]KAJ5752851.1 hypothetical protein N7520_009768 [Penicillium odoratum]